MRPSSSSRRAPARDAAPARGAGERGFTLMEILLAICLSLLSGVQNDAMNRATMALDKRDVSVAADTVFRRMIYEVDQVQDGASAGLDQWYGDYIGLTGAAKDRWAIYRAVQHKKRGLAAGTDPSGKYQDLFSEIGSEKAPAAPTTSSGSPTATSDTSGTQVYQLSLDVYLAGEGGGIEENEEPVASLRTIIPVPVKELEDR
jgi:hypothetical protein